MKGNGKTVGVRGSAERSGSKLGSALVGAIWILAVLSVLIATYAVDAQLQTRINLYLQERVRVDHLTDAGIAIAEVILLDYNTVKKSDDADYEDEYEKHRWYNEWIAVQSNEECDTGAVPVDALNPRAGTVRVRIKPIESKWNINTLYPKGNQKYAEIWEAVLAMSGIPEDYWDGIVDSWCDWRDEDGNMNGEYGAETDFYKSAYEDFIDGMDTDKNANYLPASRNGEILNLDDLMHLKGFNEYEDEPISAQAILYGGILNPLADKEEQIEIKGIARYFDVEGSGKINPKMADAEILATVPGIWQPTATGASAFNETDITNAMELAQSICELRGESIILNKERVRSGSAGVDEEIADAFNSFELLKKEVNEGSDNSSSLYLQDEAGQYLDFPKGPDGGGKFEIVITGESMGITHTVRAVVSVEKGKVRYERWEEDP